MSASASAEPDLIHDLITRPIPKNLWHYTSYTAFQGIVEKKKIFATDLRYLNDTQEFVHARELVQKVVEESTDSSETGQALAIFFKDALNQAFGDGGLLHPDRLQVMVASFSEARDQLSQWRGYSRASSGVSISFNLGKIRPPLEIGTAVVFAPCVYNLSAKKKLLDRVLLHVTNVIIEWDKEVREAVQADPHLISKIRDASQLGPPYIKGPSLPSRFHSALRTVCFELARICPLLKDPSFSEEREWRLVLPLFAGRRLKDSRLYRPSYNTIIPYVEHPLCDLNEIVPINDLILGPGSHVHAKSAVSAFLKEHQITVVPQASNVPYRASS